MCSQPHTLEGASVKLRMLQMKDQGLSKIVIVDALNYQNFVDDGNYIIINIYDYVLKS